MTTRKTTRKAAPRRRAARPRPAPIDSQMRQVWLAGLGMMVSTGETANEIVEALVARGRKREPATRAAAARAVRDARRAVESLAAEAQRRSLRLVDDAIERLGAKQRPRPRNILHLLGDFAEALL